MMTHAEQIAKLDIQLAGSPNDWQRKVLTLILKIPSGHLISYGNLARWANQEFGLKLRARNISWLRRKLYGILGHETEVPIHRIATQGDLKSSLDHPYTQEVNKEKRTREGSYANPIWIIK